MFSNEFFRSLFSLGIDDPVFLTESLSITELFLVCEQWGVISILCIGVLVSCKSSFCVLIEVYPEKSRFVFLRNLPRIGVA